MGAAAAVDLGKPIDGSDIISNGTLDYARSEIIHLRTELGHLAQKYGMEVMPIDASDLISGNNEKDDFDRVVREVVHIRACTPSPLPLLPAGEIIHLRTELGHLAQKYGMEVMPIDASDLISGNNEKDDFDRVVREVVHIRACLRLNTQSSKRRTRYTAPLAAEMDDGKSGDSSSEDSSSDEEESKSAETKN
eukprot:CAMPEP_0173359244 /NCGR_PEP_ID=MMETSP1144-20121109/19925_1 /TAXON_ID=483371 /ORGANISM="non described non described, Strain CCMP2298" /LENGTH=191 /DNA_ID=CAMNT_0014308467 /DNA_START=46 /DNA_END=621 /DNA_ORIENTATION=-